MTAPVLNLVKDMERSMKFTCASCKHFNREDTTCASPDKQYGRFAMPIKLKSASGTCGLHPLNKQEPEKRMTTKQKLVQLRRAWDSIEGGSSFTEHYVARQFDALFESLTFRGQKVSLNNRDRYDMFVSCTGSASTAYFDAIAYALDGSASC